MNDGKNQLVGLRPWFPWPLDGWRWWTAPVRAERLAALRIGLALCLLADLFLTYLPRFEDFFSDRYLAAPAIQGYWSRFPRYYWTFLGGWSQPVLGTLTLLLWLGSSGLIILEILGAWSQRKQGPVQPGKVRRWVWGASGFLFVCGIWARQLQKGEVTTLTWLLPLVFWVLALSLTLGTWWMQRHKQGSWWKKILSSWPLWLLPSVALLIGSWWTWEPPDPESVAWNWLRPWQADFGLFWTSIIAWFLATFFLLLGWQTGWMAFLTWFLSYSFANLNPDVDNAGDTVRIIILFYLMISPCGAAWSVDSWRLRRLGKRAETVWIHPWPLRLLFLQMAMIYFFNGLYKVGGASWQEGNSLYYVLCGPALTRVSYAQFPIPVWITQMMTWSVLAWELAFPLLMCLPYIRPVTLVFGAFFHLGIFLSLELGWFGPYMLTLYLPLLPWERWVGKK